MVILVIFLVFFLSDRLNIICRHHVIPGCVKLVIHPVYPVPRCNVREQYYPVPVLLFHRVLVRRPPSPRENQHVTNLNISVK